MAVWFHWENARVKLQEEVSCREPLMEQLYMSTNQIRVFMLQQDVSVLTEPNLSNNSFVTKYRIELNTIETDWSKQSISIRLVLSLS